MRLNVVDELLNNTNCQQPTPRHHPGDRVRGQLGGGMPLALDSLFMDQQLIVVHDVNSISRTAPVIDPSKSGGDLL